MPLVHLIASWQDNIDWKVIVQEVYDLTLGHFGNLLADRVEHSMPLQATGVVNCNGRSYCRVALEYNYGVAWHELNSLGVLVNFTIHEDYPMYLLTPEGEKVINKSPYFCGTSQHVLDEGKLVQQEVYLGSWAGD